MALRFPTMEHLIEAGLLTPKVRRVFTDFWGFYRFLGVLQIFGVFTDFGGFYRFLGFLQIF